MPTLSVVMIVKNEAHCLGDCLESIREFADELVIGDTGSTDETVAIARGFGARVVSVEWHNDFAEARNVVLNAATGDWLLQLDADEVVDRVNARRIRDLVDVDGDGADAIEVTLANYCDTPRAWRWVPAPPNDPFSRGKSGYIAVGLLRLFRHRRGFEYREPVHENITESVEEAGGVVRPQPIVIHHYGYESDGSGIKGERYLSIAREKAALRADDPKAWYDLAEQHLALDHTDEAEEAARRALALAPEHIGAATTLGNILLNRGDLEDARALFLRLEADGTSPPHVSTALAAIACKQGRVNEALGRLEAVVRAVPTHIMARLYLARALDLACCFTDAREHLAAALACAPNLSELQQRIEAHKLRAHGENQARSGNLDTALATFVRGLRLDPEDPLLHLDAGVALNTLGVTEGANRSFARAALLAASLNGYREFLPDRSGVAGSPADNG
jgi:Flp pilus assembly protein TadD